MPDQKTEADFRKWLTACISNDLTTGSISIRRYALQCALTHHVGQSDEASDVVSTAKQFEAFIVGEDGAEQG